MEYEIRESFVNVIKNEIDRLPTLEPGSKEHSEAIDSLAKLYKLNIEETEKEREFMDRCDRDIDREREWKIKNAQLEGQKWDRYVGIVLGIAGIIVPPVLNYTCNMGFAKRICQFEKTETFTSSPGKAMSRGLFKFIR